MMRNLETSVPLYTLVNSLYKGLIDVENPAALFTFKVIMIG